MNVVLVIQEYLVVVKYDSKKKLSLLGLFLAFAFLPLVSAVTIESGTIIENTVLNTTINFTSQAFADSFTTSPSGFIYFDAFRRSGNETITFNLTEQNKNYFGTDLPWFAQSSLTEKTIISNITQNLTTTTIISINCDVIGRITYTSATGSFNQVLNTGDYTCNNNQATIILTVELGENTLTLENNNAIQTICDQSDITYTDAAGLAGIILTIILIGGVLAITLLSFSGVTNFNLGSFKPADLTLTEIIGGIIIIGLTFLVIATMAFLTGGNYCPAIGG